MKVEKVIELINKALPLQFRSATAYTWAAGGGTGIEFQAVGLKLQDFGILELNDARHLVEKVTALGGTAPTTVAGFSLGGDTTSVVEKLIDYENEALEALHAVIPETGQEPRSEALEHRLEHIIMRKQEQVDFLERVRLGG